MNKFSLYTLKVTTRLLQTIERLVTRQYADLKTLTPAEQEALIFPRLDILPHIAGVHMLYTDLYRRTFRWLEVRGLHLVPNHFYFPIPDTRELNANPDLWSRESELAGVDLNIETQLRFTRQIFPLYQKEYDQFPQGPSPDLTPYQFHFMNGMFDGLDALVLYCMVRHFKPRRILEVGSGWSSRVSAQAALQNGNTQLVCIEPYPDEILKAGFPGLTSLIPKKVEQVELAVFEQLEENDILFIDTSHVIKTAGDVNYLYLEVIPRLKNGVVIHIHDIFLPYEYWKNWVTEELRFWDEQYLLQSFLAFNASFSVLFANTYMRTKYPDELRQTFSKCPFFDAGQSFWMQRVKS